MNDPVSKAAALATRLPYIDRRSLSEAWFSALHLASDGPVRADVPERRAPSELRAAPRRSATSGNDPVRPSAPVPPRMRTPAVLKTQPGSIAAARPSASVRAARASEALRRARSYPPFRTSLTIGLEHHRVQLLLRRDAGTLHVVALCSARIAEIVRRALTCADAHLRGRGEAVRSTVHVVGMGEGSA